MAQCAAQRKHGAGPCKRTAIPGGRVCAMHGGNAPQVRRKAQQRIDEAAGNLVQSLIDIALDQQTRDGRPVEPKDIIAAAKQLLDRSNEVRQPGVEVKHTGDAAAAQLPAYHALLEIARQRIETLEASGASKGRVIGALEDAIDAEVVEDE